MPRPSKRTPEVEQTILAALRKGTPLAVICRDSEELPHPETWRAWCEADETLALAYAHAREEGEDVIAAESLEIIDEDPEYYSTENGTRIDPASVAHKKARAEHRLKLLAIWNPKKFGTKVDLTTGGEKIVPPPEEAAMRAAALMELAKRRKGKKS